LKFCAACTSQPGRQPVRLPPGRPHCDGLADQGRYVDVGSRLPPTGQHRCAVGEAGGNPQGTIKDQFSTRKVVVEESRTHANEVFPSLKGSRPLQLAERSSDWAAWGHDLIRTKLSRMGRPRASLSVRPEMCYTRRGERQRGGRLDFQKSLHRFPNRFPAKPPLNRATVSERSEHRASASHGSFAGKRFGIYGADFWKVKPNLTLTLAPCAITTSRAHDSDAVVFPILRAGPRIKVMPPGSPI